MRFITVVFRLFLLVGLVAGGPVQLRAGVADRTLPTETQFMASTTAAEQPRQPAPPLTAKASASSLGSSLRVYVCGIILVLGLGLALLLPSKRPEAPPPVPMIRAEVPPLRDLSHWEKNPFAGLNPAMLRQGKQTGSFPPSTEAELNKIRGLLEEMVSRAKESR